MFTLRDQEFDGFAAILRGDLDPALVLVVATKLDPAIHLRDHRTVLRPAGLEQLGHPRKTAGDVTGLGTLGRHPSQDFARPDFVPVTHRQDGTHREKIAGLPAVREPAIGTRLVQHRHGRAQVAALG